MELPSSVVICGIPYQVRYFDSMAEVGYDDELVFGEMSGNAREMRIFKSPRVEDTYNTLIHEIIHCIIYEKKSLQEAVGKKEEVFTTDFATDLTDTLMRNGLVNLDVRDAGGENRSGS